LVPGWYKKTPDFKERAMSEVVLPGRNPEKKRLLPVLAGPRTKLPGEDWVAVKCSCGKMVAAPRGWSFFVKTTTEGGKCVHVVHELPELPDQEAKRRASKDKRVRQAGGGR